MTDDATPPGDSGTPGNLVDEHAEREKFLARVGFTAEERAAIIADDLPAITVFALAITRMAEQLGAMEAYLRAKIASEKRGGRIVMPYKN